MLRKSRFATAQDFKTGARVRESSSWVGYQAKEDLSNSVPKVDLESPTSYYWLTMELQNIQPTMVVEADSFSLKNGLPPDSIIDAPHVNFWQAPPTCKVSKENLVLDNNIHKKKINSYKLPHKRPLKSYFTIISKIINSPAQFFLLLHQKLIKEKVLLVMNKLSLFSLIFSFMLLGIIFFIAGFLVAANINSFSKNASQNYHKPSEIAMSHNIASNSKKIPQGNKLIPDKYNKMGKVIMFNQPHTPTVREKGSNYHNHHAPQHNYRYFPEQQNYRYQNTQNSGQ